MPTPSLRKIARLIALLACWCAISPAVGRVLPAQVAPEIERPVPFDSAGRVMVLTPNLVSRLALSAPRWPVTGEFREARLFARSSGGFALIVTLQDGAVARYLLDDDSILTLRSSVSAAVLASTDRGERLPGSGVVELSQPAGNAFVRNQTFLGLAAYGPATAAILSNSGGAAASGGYFLAAGSAFFIAANTVKNKTVTRAQNQLASHAGVRGAIAGSGVAVIANADGGAGYGTPILLGAVAGTVAGYQGARRLTDGEAAASGLIADLAALTTLGLGGSFGLYERETIILDEFGNVDRRLRASGKAAIGASIAAGIAGYVAGPRYARRASYNVTDGDASVAFAGAAVGTVGALALAGGDDNRERAFAMGTAGLLTGFWLADRALVRTGDRTPANGTLTQLGTIAGALMGGGVAAMLEADGPVALGLAATGGLLGLAATDRLLSPAPDAGPMRGIMQSSSVQSPDKRVTVSLTPLATALAMQHVAPTRSEPVYSGPHALGVRPAINRFPMLSIAW